MHEVAFAFWQECRLIIQMTKGWPRESPKLPPCPGSPAGHVVHGACGSRGPLKRSRSILTHLVNDQGEGESEKTFLATNSIQPCRISQNPYVSRASSTHLTYGVGWNTSYKGTMRVEMWLRKRCDRVTFLFVTRHLLDCFRRVSQLRLRTIHNVAPSPGSRKHIALE